MGISVALCTYNGEKFLREQLESIAAQTVLPAEMVVCDDGSSDDTLKIINQFAESAPFPVQIQKNETNLGSTKNFEKAIGLCSGEIIALCDQDDIWKPHKIERIASVFQEFPDTGYVFSDAELVDENLKSLHCSLWEVVGFEGQFKSLYMQGDQFRCFTKQHFVTGATMAFRSTISKLAMPFPITGFWIHDGWLGLISTATGAIGVPISEPLIVYRQHAGQQVGAPDQTETYSKSLYGMYLRLKEESEHLFAAWEKHCIQVIEVKDKLNQLAIDCPTPALKKNLMFLEEFETHFVNRREILSSGNSRRYGLILREFFSGRYARFSDSWRSMARDLFL